MFICNSLPSKFIVEIDGNAIVVIYVDLIPSLLKVECNIFIFFLVTPKVLFV